MIGPRARIRANCVLYGPCKLEDDVFINDGVWIDQQTTIGASCAIGPFARFITHTHETGGGLHRAGDVSVRPIHVGPGAWIGAEASVLPGVSIGAGAVVAAGSLVTRDVPPHTMVMGRPARVVSRLDREDER
ncbi:acyltransferase [Nocardioides mangrovicus]|uniref:Acyltransferase n=1 Tax=Nocardioides mangrovicus TaxID=2478913 RepID=A0A3L8P4Z4_9ACTN|nr:acyltransferase [Nocardioides mangrovicus]